MVLKQTSLFMSTRPTGPDSYYPTYMARLHGLFTGFLLISIELSRTAIQHDTHLARAGCFVRVMRVFFFYYFYVVNYYCSRNQKL